MECPKCGASGPAVIRVEGLSQSSQLSRLDCSGGVMISGFSCRLCGKWWESFGAPVVALTPEALDSGMVSGAATIAIVLRFYGCIALCRAVSVTFEAIARQLTQAGHKCCDRTLQKYFLLEQGKRRSDGCSEAQTA